MSNLGVRAIYSIKQNTENKIHISGIKITIQFFFKTMHFHRIFFIVKI